MNIYICKYFQIYFIINTLKQHNYMDVVYITRDEENGLTQLQPQ